MTCLGLMSISGKMLTQDSLADFSDLKRLRKYPCRPVILCTDDLSQDAEKICVQIHGLELGEQDRSVV